MDTSYAPGNKDVAGAQDGERRAFGTLTVAWQVPFTADNEHMPSDIQPIGDEDGK